MNNSSIFQIDSDIVKKEYNNDNYLIEYDSNAKDKKSCVVYFSSNDIYFPNQEEVFEARIVSLNFFEWYKNRINGAYKHIFLRDIKKQWYIEGINAKINTPELLKAFLVEETKGFSTVMLGSSAGGYAAVLYGSILNVERVYSFNGQTELNSLIQTSSYSIDPLIFRYHQTSLSKYFDLKEFINPKVSIYYFVSILSAWDKQQYDHIKKLNILKAIPFKTGHHGIPFLKAALPLVINLPAKELEKWVEKKHHPIIFSARLLGVSKTFAALNKQVFSLIKKKISRFMK